MLGETNQTAHSHTTPVAYHRAFPIPVLCPPARRSTAIPRVSGPIHQSTLTQPSAITENELRRCAMIYRNILAPVNRSAASLRHLTALSLLAAGILPGATTKVTLNSSTTPSVADIIVTTVTAIGHGFPSGTIPPANITVTLDPTVSGSGPSGTTIATNVTVVSGNTERVNFRVPSSIAVTTATSYQVSIAGTTSAGTPFESSNSAQLTINPPVSVTTTSLPVGTVGPAYSSTLTATGGSGGYTWSLFSGSLPAGLTLASSGLIGGTPSAAGTAPITVKAADSDGLTARQNLSITVDSAITITTTSLPAGTVGIPYSQTFTATGGSGQYTWSVSAGALPAGLTLSASSGQLSGTPSAAGTYSFTITVTDSNQATASRPFSLTINSGLTITTAPELPTGTVGVPYSQTLTATGGSPPYTWSMSSGSLPPGLSLASSAGSIGGTPRTAVADTFKIQVTDTRGATATRGFSLTIDPAIVITTSSPLPNGEVTVPYSLTLAATGGSGQYTWTISTGALPAGLTLTASTGAIGGTPTSAATANFTIVATDTNQATNSKPFALTVNPAPQILSLSPNNGNQGVSLQVTITGQNTNFVQGITQASFGPAIAVGGGTAGQPGPVTVSSPTSATASLVISSTAATGSQTVTVTTGPEQESLTNGFTIQGAVTILTVNTNEVTPLAPNLSGFNDPYLLYGVEYWDPKYVPLVQALKPGWIRFPGGTTSMAFDWETAHENTTWMAELANTIPLPLYQGIEMAQELTQAKGGACLAGGSCVSDFATFVKTLGVDASVVVNGYTDTNPDTAGKMVSAAEGAGIDTIAWELDNEAYCCNKIFANPAAYLAAAYNPYYLNINSADPNALTAVSFIGRYSGDRSIPSWDPGIESYSPHYWQGAVFHNYPITDTSISVTDEEQTLNGILAYGTTDYYTTYIQPIIGTGTPVFFTEMNSDGHGILAFESYIYNAIYLSEWTARMSTIPQVKAVGIADLFLGNEYNEGTIRAVNDFQTYLIDQVLANPNFSTNTATDPNTQYQFYYSTVALAMEIVNQAINGSDGTWATTVNGGPTVPIQGFNGQPIPAIYAQGYQGTDGTHYVLIFNKSASSVQIALEADGTLLETTLAETYISSPSDSAQNTATNQAAVQIQTGTSSNPLTIGPYSVTRVQW